MQNAQHFARTWATTNQVGEQAQYTPKFDFTAGRFNQKIIVESVQTEVDAGYEGKNQIVLIEAKNSQTKNTIIRQLYYPYRQWQYHSMNHLAASREVSCRR
ncbi:MAG: hypothetical protein LBC27_05220 [Spirochaetaceae bacterium]|jgi:hypothetical protein|nr:hypothetical protein [Spirochaetaceae bacterium]